MFYMLIYLINMIFSTIFSFMKHPLAMGLMLLNQTFFICLASGMLTKSYWFSYILFLTFVGGLLVLFIYVTSLASNEMFKFSTKIITISIIFITFNLTMILLLDKTLVSNYFLNYETINLFYLNSYMAENSLMLNMMYNSPINMITIMLMIYLFLTLIAVVKITNIFEGPLRPKFN
uniref:NADH dehydrogenase subunit 6 n=1 Tax=Smittia aterrima TaxID=611654 RepID=UPI0022DCDFA6|nr:NADH dehydrogenase subunit 6 [Smittia aterrima]WAB46363.1 NADH dehydrogenase subunit 6 [Smittia aterrima]